MRVVFVRFDDLAGVAVDVERWRLLRGKVSLEDIAYNMIFIKRASDYAAVNEVYKEFFPGAAPARFCIICELVKPEFLVEISSIAHCTTMPQEGNYLRARAANSP